ncbi:MAG: protein kinase [Myxococcales bacterium]|nr:protein kinase [Myxococcales bacterium]
MSNPSEPSDVPPPLPSDEAEQSAGRVSPITKVQRFRTTSSLSEVPKPLAESPRGHAQADAQTRIVGAGRAEVDTRYEVDVTNSDTAADALRNLTSALYLEVDGAPEFDDVTEHEGRYVAVEELGRGGMGRVVRVTDRWLGRDVAMKLLHTDSRESREHIMALRREAQIIGGLEHPSIIPVHEIGTRGDGSTYYTMKLVAHTSLGEVIDRLSLGDREAAERYGLRALVGIFVKIAQALEYAHSAGVVHRDLKPENVLLGEFGEVQVMDWGIAKRLGGQRPDGAEGLVVGTPAYMSPEQAAGHDSRTDNRSDIYSLGVMLYEVLALRRPYSGDNSQQQLEATKNVTPLPPSKVSRDSTVPAELDALVMHMLAKEPEQRPQSMRDVWQSLERFLAGELERQRRRQRAESCHERALAELERYRDMQTERAFLQQETEHLTRMVRPWDEQRSKQQLVDLRHRLQVLDVLYAHAFGTVTELLRDAIEADGHEQARRTLIALYWERHDDAETQEDSATKLFFARLAHDLEGEGNPSSELVVGSLHIRSQPVGATVYAIPFSEYRDGGSISPRYELGRTPLVAIELPIGPYVLVARIDGHRDAQETFYVREKAHDLLLLCDPWTADFPLIGREVELARLWSLLDDIEVRSRPITCLVSGAPGMGKNMLLDGFRTKVKDHPTRLYLLLEVACEPLRRDLPYAVVVEMVRLRGAVLLSDSAETVRQKVRRMVVQAFSRFGQRQLGDKERQEAHQVADTISALPAFDLDDPARSSLRRDLTESGRLALMHALATYFQRLAVSAPVLMLVRNAQYMDSASRDFFRDLLALVRGAPILVVASASALGRDDVPRPGMVGQQRPNDPPLDFDEHIDLQPLRDLSLDQLVRELLMAPVNPKLSNWLREHSDGNPFLAAELIAVLAQRDAMSFESAEWRLQRSRLPEFAPGDLDGAVRLLIETLPQQAREVLSVAVVVGRTFWAGALRQMLDSDVASALDVLEQRGFVSRTANSRYHREPEYRLTSSLRWRVAYDLQPPQRRRGFHRQTAAWMAGHGRTDLEESLAIAYHLEMGGQPESAAVLLTRTARAAQAAGALEEAARLFTRVHILTDDLSVQDTVELALRTLQARIRKRRRRRRETLY